MITPIRFKTRKEIEETNERIRKLGRAGLITLHLKLGWSQKSAEILADAMLSGIDEE